MTSHERADDYVPVEEDFEDSRIEPANETLAVLKRIERNTSVIRAWVQFAGAVWLVAMAGYFLMQSLVPPGPRR